MVATAPTDKWLELCLVGGLVFTALILDPGALMWLKGLLVMLKLSATPTLPLALPTELRARI